MRLCVVLVVSAVGVFAVGCGEEAAVERQEEEAGVEEIEETTVQTADGARGEGPAVPSEKAKAAMKAGDEAQAKGQGGVTPGDQERLAVGTCQGEEMLADLGPERAQRVGDEIVQEVIAGEFKNIQGAYASRGYTCGGRYEKVFNP